MNLNHYGPGSLSLMSTAPIVFVNTAPKTESEAVAASALTSLLSTPASPTQTATNLRTKMTSKEFKLPERFTKNGRKRAVPFPLKLMQVLSDKKYSNIISWMPGGKSFVVIRPTEFVKEILPKHFKSAQYASFTRKLTRWGFSRCEDGTGEFYHPQFRKGRVDLAERMACRGCNEKTSHSEMAIHRSIDKSTKHSVESREENSSTRGHQQYKLSGFHKLHENMAKQHALAMEIEMLRFQRSIRAAAASREILAGMQRSNLALTSGSSRALAIVDGLPEVPVSNSAYPSMRSIEHRHRHANIQEVTSA